VYFTGTKETSNYTFNIWESIAQI